MKTELYKKPLLKILYLNLSAMLFYIFMEWLFFVTKPSFMRAMTPWQDITVFLLTVVIIAAPLMILIVSIWIGSKVFSAEKVSFWFGAGLAALISASVTLILIDNFTYTLLKIGIVSSHVVFRAAYALFFIFLIIFFFRKNLFFLLSSEEITPFFSSLILLLLFSAGIVFFLQIPVSRQGLAQVREKDMALPNIILLGIDGVNAENMSVYGYERDTTPNIKIYARDALLAENAFSNSGNTGGSLTSMLTGKLPLETRVIYPPDILMGEDAYQHLPALLKELGYRTVQITMPSFGDAYDRNLKAGFDSCNFRTDGEMRFAALTRRLGAEKGFYFANIIFERIAERLEHIFFLQKMKNPYEIVTQPIDWFSENKRFSGMLAALDEKNDAPLFLHVHMLGTHGPLFAPRTRFFSAGNEQTEKWMVDFYDDAIRDFDARFNMLLKHLDQNGMLENTLIILYSDHGEKWNSKNRVPLIFWFPDSAHVGTIKENVQLLDIAPTILDYLNSPPPDWMRGRSLLSDELSANYPVFSADVAADAVENVDGEWLIVEDAISPPFYQLGKVNLIVCDRWFSLDMRRHLLSYDKVSGSTALCDSAEIPSPEEAEEMILRKLAENGYDISAYPPE